MAIAMAMGVGRKQKVEAGLWLWEAGIEVGVWMLEAGKYSHIFEPLSRI